MAMSTGIPEPNRRTTSARVAAARREVLVATLYRHEYKRSKGVDNKPAQPPSVDVVKYSCEASVAPPLYDGREAVLLTTTPVLRFAMAHGLQVMQRAMVAVSSAIGERQYHYVEAMACPSGCVNGGGQIPATVTAGGSGGKPSRETPSESRARVASAARHLALPLLGVYPYRSRWIENPGDSDSDDIEPNGSSLRTSWNGIRTSNRRHPPPLYRRSDLLQTSFQVVQPLEFRSGATKGMAVQDMKW
jgi:hypothetical protein